MSSSPTSPTRGIGCPQRLRKHPARRLAPPTLRYAYRAIRPPTDHREIGMVFTYRLEKEDGTSADPPVLHTAAPTWHVGVVDVPSARDRSRTRCS